MTLLSAEGITHRFNNTTTPALHDVSISVEEGETLALVGESGCGKSTLGRVLAGLISPTQGSVAYQDRQITDLDRQSKKEFRRSVQLVQQDPFASLNPSLTLRTTLGYAMKYHRIVTGRRIDDHLFELLDTVGLEATPQFLSRYPHQLSGGQRQRVAIARAIGLKPKLIVADEAVSMLDVSMRVSILDLMLKYQADAGASYLFISHDFGVVRYFSSRGRIAVMFYGHVVEEGTTAEVIHRPQHPYTANLLEEIPIANPRLARARKAERIPDPVDVKASPTGCVFSGRCHFARDRCRREAPPLTGTDGHRSACWYPEDVPVPLLARRPTTVAS